MVQHARRRAHRWSLGWIAAALCLSGAVLLASPSAAAAATVSCDELNLTGHRGYGVGPDENTVPHLQRAAEAGARSVEFDVRRTKDGVLAVMHDARVDRTTDGTGLVSRLLWRTFAALCTESGYNPPSLVMVLQSMAPLGVGLQVHLKVALSDLELKRLETALKGSGLKVDQDTDVLAFAAFRSGSSDRTRTVGLAQGQFRTRELLANWTKNKVKPVLIRNNSVYPMGGGALRGSTTALSRQTQLMNS